MSLRALPRNACTAFLPCDHKDLLNALLPNFIHAGSVCYNRETIITA